MYLGHSYVTLQNWTLTGQLIVLGWCPVPNYQSTMYTEYFIWLNCYKSPNKRDYHIFSEDNSYFKCLPDITYHPGLAKQLNYTKDQKQPRHPKLDKHWKNTKFKCAAMGNRCISRFKIMDLLDICWYMVTGHQIAFGCLKGIRAKWCITGSLILTIVTLLLNSKCESMIIITP